MGVPGEAREVIRRALVAEVIEEQERIELVGRAESERAPQFHAGAFHRRLGLDDLLDGPYRHGELGSESNYQEGDESRFRTWGHWQFDSDPDLAVTRHESRVTHEYRYSVGQQVGPIRPRDVCKKPSA